jgi:hypothetical protein
MKLYHHINGTENADSDTVANVLTNGLQANHGGWADINELLPNRPKGIFFWDDDNKGIALSDRIVVDTADLDTDHLYAFSAEAAQVADLALSGYELLPGAYEFMAQAQAIPFSQFNGQFAAEWIYTDDVSAKIIEVG